MNILQVLGLLVLSGPAFIVSLTFNKINDIVPNILRIYRKYTLLWVKIACTVRYSMSKIYTLKKKKSRAFTHVPAVMLLVYVMQHLGDG